MAGKETEQGWMRGSKSLVLFAIFIPQGVPMPFPCTLLSPAQPQIFAVFPLGFLLLCTFKCKDSGQSCQWRAEGHKHPDDQSRL